MKDKNYLKYLQDSPTYYGYGGHKFLLGGFGQKIGNLFNNAVGQMKSTDGNPITSALAEAGIGASSGLGGLGGAINSMIVNPLGKLMNPNGNTTGAGKVMNAVGNVASMIPGVGGVIGASVNQLGNYVNAAFGSNLNDEFIRETKADAQNTRGFSSVAGTNEALAKDFTWLDTVTKDQVGTEGWFSNAATKETQRLNDLIMAANAMKTNQLGARANVIQENQTRNALMNNFAYGGYINNNNIYSPFSYPSETREWMASKGHQKGNGGTFASRFVDEENKATADTIWSALQMVPVIGNIIGAVDVVNDIYNMAKSDDLDWSDWGNLALDAASIIPGVNTFTKAAKVAKGVKAMNTANKLQAAADALAFTSPKGVKQIKEGVQKARQWNDRNIKAASRAARKEDYLPIGDGGKAQATRAYEAGKFTEGILSQVDNALNPTAVYYSVLRHKLKGSDRINDIFGIMETTNVPPKDVDKENVKAEGGGIHIKKKNRGKFTAAAKRAGMGVQEYARHVLANKDRYSSTLVKRANFARNFGGHKKAYGGQEDLLFNETPNQYELQNNPPKYVRSTFRNDNNVRDTLLEGLWDIHNNSKDISQRGAGILIQALNKPQGYKGLITRANEIHPIDSLFQVNEPQKALEELVKRKIGRHGMNVDMFEPTYLYDDGVIQRMRNVHDAYIDNKASKKVAAALMALNYDETLTNGIEDLYNYTKTQRTTKKGDNRIVNYGLFSLENLRPTKEEEKLAGEHRSYVEDDDMWYGQYTKFLKDNKLKDSEKSQAKFYFEKYLPARGYNLEDLNKKKDIAELVRILYKIQGGKYGQKKLQNAIDRAHFLYKSTYSEGGKLNNEETMKQLHSDIIPLAEFEPLNSSYYNPMFSSSSRHKKLRALGGGLDQDNNGVNIVNTGGTHEQNPYEGVQMGIAPDGKPNLVEEDEVIWNDYVFSNRLTIPKEMKEHYKYKHKTFADEAKDAQKESEERPNDPISMNGLEAAMGRLQAVQEFTRQQENIKNNGRRFDDGGYTELINPEILESSIFRNYLPDFQPLELPEVPDASGARIGRAPKVDFIEPKESIDASPLNSTMSYYNTVDPYYEIPNLEEDLELDRLTGKNISGYNTGNNSGNNLGNDSNGKGMNLLRLAPVIDSGIQTIVDQFRSPDYSLARDISNARRQIRDVGFTPIGGHMGYTPYDRSYLLNKINQQNAATNRAIVNNSGGNAAAAQAGLIAANYNQTNALGDALMRMDQMNEQRKMEVAQHNAEIDQYNSQGQMKADATNRALDLQRANLAVQAAKAREAIRAREEARRTANRNAFITNLGALGSEMEQRNWLNELIDSGAIRAASGFCKGGKLRKKKGGKHA